MSSAHGEGSGEQTNDSDTQSCTVDRALAVLETATVGNTREHKRLRAEKARLLSDVEAVSQRARNFMKRSSQLLGESESTSMPPPHRTAAAGKDTPNAKAETEAKDALSKALGKQPSPNVFSRRWSLQPGDQPKPAGASDVSKECQGLAQAECEDKGCTFDGSCQDASIWEVCLC